MSVPSTALVTTLGDFAAEYPYLAEVVIELGKSGYDYTEEFEVALDLILYGIERLKQEDSSIDIAPA